MVVFPGVAKTVQAGAAPGRRRVAASRAFALPEDAPAAGEAAVAGPATLHGLLALQEAAGEAPAAEAQDRAARRQGEAAMRDLTALQVALLSGRPAAAAHLAALASAGLASAGPQAADPGLAAVLGAIRLRAAVELARTVLRPESRIENPSPTKS